MLSDEQRSGLWMAKLRSLARNQLDRHEGVEHPTPWGAALEHDGVWTILIEASPERSFGQALVLAARNQATSLDVIVDDDDASAVARRAQLFTPSPNVWQIDDTELSPAVASLPKRLVAAELEPECRSLLTVDEVDIVIEHGVIVGECRGLEVARVTGAGDEQRVDVGVGAYDQGAFAVMNPNLTPTGALAAVVAQVLEHRSRGAEPHPINRLARERWVRSELLDAPAIIGLATLEVVEPLLVRTGIKDVTIAAALGTADNGDRVLVACSVGIDLDAVPAAVDLAEIHDADRILMVVPDRDRHPIVQAVAAQSRRPIEFATSPEPWSTSS